MPCTKTGAQIYLTPYGLWAIADAHQCADVTYFRIARTASSALRDDALHFEVGNFDGWFDRDDLNGRSSTMICKTVDIVDHGYDGTPIDPNSSLPEIWK